ncbi:conserved hypothetical protein [Ammonifex degensii KC4]|uniref:Uncharacterized protein n=1 Tax=Ammonifex degensii (strain DSM 10501 / KC4) TaxID=429009 RepID=C9RA83_AMMDK|nr:hypothetical protein [Ammonifex degensii]ACX51192.1 conserved hypothetical protein [Ammonifex degensii KC4]
MLKGLVMEAVSLPEELEKVLLEVGEVRSRLAELEEAKKAKEIEALKHAAGNGKNETERKAVMAAYLANDPEYQRLSQEEKQAKARLQELEAKVEVVKARVKLTRELLHLTAKAIEANHAGALEALELEATEARQEKREKKNGEAWQADWVWIRGEVLELGKGKKPGVVKAVVETPEGSKHVVYANGNGTAEKLAARLGSRVAVKAKKLESGNFLAVAVE